MRVVVTGSSGLIGSRLVPALRASSPHLLSSLKHTGRGGGSSSRRLRSALVVVEVALALVLVAGAGLMIRSFVKLMAVPTGFDPEGVVTMRLTLPPAKYADVPRWLAFHDELANPHGGDRVAGQSTRLTCALPTNMQCTYDPREIEKIVPGDAYNVIPLKQLQGLPATFDWHRDPINTDLDGRLRDCSPITHLTKDDPPVFAMNNQANEKDGNIHHPNFGRHLKKQMDQAGVYCEFHLVSDFPGQQARTEAMLAFLKKNFGMKLKDQ